MDGEQEVERGILRGKRRGRREEEGNNVRGMDSGERREKRVRRRRMGKDDWG